MKYFSVIHILLMMLLVICFVEALEEDPAYRFSSIRRRKRFFRLSCRDIRLICPTQEKHFVVRSSWGGLFRGCELEEPILDTILKQCNNSIMDQCKEGWVDHEDNNNCSSPITKELLDSVFHPACTLHDLCYLSLNTTRYNCDRWFLHNLKQMCDIRRFWPCKTTAHAMYLAVRGFGARGFTRMHRWARKNCMGGLLESTGNRKGIFENGSGEFSGSGSGSGIVPVVPDVIEY